MMDIVERLRSDYGIGYETRIEAADEIERLREMLETQNYIDFVLDGHGIAHKNFVIVYKAVKDGE